MAIEDFSNGYYKADMSVQPYSDGPTIEQGLYDYIARKVYYKTDAPVTMRVGLNAGPMFSPSAESGIPTNVLGLPLSDIEDSSIHPSDDNVAVFVLKPEFAYLFNSAEKLGEQFMDSSNLSDNTLEKEDRRFFNLDGDN
jgi:hypothetical protein